MKSTAFISVFTSPSRLSSPGRKKEIGSGEVQSLTKKKFFWFVQHGKAFRGKNLSDSNHLCSLYCYYFSGCLKTKLSGWQIPEGVIHISYWFWVLVKRFSMLYTPHLKQNSVFVFVIVLFWVFFYGIFACIKRWWWQWWKEDLGFSSFYVHGFVSCCFNIVGPKAREKKIMLFGSESHQKIKAELDTVLRSWERSNQDWNMFLSLYIYPWSHQIQW